MIDRRVSGVLVAAITLWVITGLLILAAWGLALAGDWDAGFMLGLTACAMSAAAATVQVRHFATKICVLMRKLH